MPSLIQKIRSIGARVRRGMLGLSRREKVALAKRELERQLRANGLSRSEARREINLRFNSTNDG